jgi:hypothetical protein
MDHMYRRTHGKTCEQCGTPFVGGVHAARRYCFKCAIARQNDPIKRKAHQVVHRAVRSGQLPPASTLACVDCGDTARDYDHRDYAKPLEVEAVCRPCNRLRGPGANALYVDKAPPRRVEGADPVSGSSVRHDPNALSLAHF